MHPWNEALFEAVKARHERFPHALLIHGARGIGKLALAERIAQFLLCESEASRPCGLCEGCRWLAAGSHPDLRRVEPEALAGTTAAEEEGEGGESPAKRSKPSTEIKVSQVRELAAFLNLGSHRGRVRVALVHPAEDMNPNAANALLKGLEEPPAGAVFLLVSHRPARLLPTIRSRCVALPVPIPSRESALHWLAGRTDQQAERWLAYAGGAPLRALEYAADGATLERLLERAVPVDSREEVEVLAEALQKMALDRALAAFGLPPKYGTFRGPVPPAQARAWLTYARQMGTERQLASHPLNPRLFSMQLLHRRPQR